MNTLDFLHEIQQVRIEKGQRDVKYSEGIQKNHPRGLKVKHSVWALWHWLEWSEWWFKLTICPHRLWWPGTVPALLRQSLAFWQKRLSVWRCATTRVAVKWLQIWRGRLSRGGRWAEKKGGDVTLRGYKRLKRGRIQGTWWKLILCERLVVIQFDLNFRLKLTAIWSNGCFLPLFLFSLIFCSYYLHPYISFKDS